MDDKAIIAHIAWGEMEIKINNETFAFKDCKVWTNGAKEWDWSLTGTSQYPGIQPVDIEELIAQGVDVMILSRGMLKRLGVCRETEELLRLREIEYHIEETKRAVELFNRFVSEGRRVGGVFHSTC